jgi:hypothetical protein
LTAQFELFILSALGGIVSLGRIGREKLLLIEGSLPGFIGFGLSQFGLAALAFGRLRGAQSLGPGSIRSGAIRFGLRSLSVCLSALSLGARTLRFR